MQTPNLDWHSPAKRYLERLGIAESASQKASHRRGKFRYVASEYHRALIACLDRNDEDGFKALKLTEGYASSLGV